MVRFVLRFLEATQSRQRFLEVRWMPYRHRIGIHQIRTDPPITTIYINFFFCGNMTVVFACKSVHLKDDFFRATQLDRECFRIVSFDTSFEVVLPCGILCNLLSSRTCDRVAGPS